MRIGLVPELNPEAGGAHQYALSILDGLALLARERRLPESDQLHLLLGAHALANDLKRGLPAWPEHSLFPPPARSRRLAIRLLGEDRAAALGSLLRGRLRSSDRIRTGGPAGPTPESPDIPVPPPRRLPALQEWHRKLGIDWNFFMMPHSLAFEAGLPFVMPVHDLQHRLQPEFPETSADGQFAVREYLFRHSAREALLLLADSETGKEDILNCYADYGITAERVFVLPFVSAAYVREPPSSEQRRSVRVQYRLPEQYYFYPAQFWPHKNHLRIIEALALLRDQERVEIHVVFCGAHSNPLRTAAFSELQQRIGKLRLESQVHCLPYVPNDVITTLYAEAHALLMPTFFGPTNIPPLEAWSLDCPVITSDIRGIRDQMNGAALLVDPRSIDSIAGGILELWKNDELRLELVRRGRQRLEACGFDDFTQRLREIVMTANELCHPSKRTA